MRLFKGGVGDASGSFSKHEGKGGAFVLKTLKIKTSLNMWLVEVKQSLCQF